MSRLMLMLSLALLAMPPAFSQATFLGVPGHQPVWQQSRDGGYYDATGVIKGTVAAQDLYLYGGRMDGGQQVISGTKYRDMDGALLDPQQYAYYKNVIDNRIKQLKDMRDTMKEHGEPKAAWQNLDYEINMLKAQKNSAQYGAMNPNQTTNFPALSQLFPGGVPSYFPSSLQASNPYGYGSPYNSYGSPYDAYGTSAYGSPYADPYLTPYNQSSGLGGLLQGSTGNGLMQQGLSLLRSQFGF
ncbi:MAG: hypothetical protein K2Y22_03465 [Candidatus Obscuribacterales bacterium]|nr:hypothetical protein [Candidatus Obscuribacterales bacterium]